MNGPLKKLMSALLSASMLLSYCPSMAEEEQHDPGSSALFGVAVVKKDKNPVLTEQTIDVSLFTDSTMKESMPGAQTRVQKKNTKGLLAAPKAAPGGTSISITGELPEGTTAAGWPVSPDMGKELELIQAWELVLIDTEGQQMPLQDVDVQLNMAADPEAEVYSVSDQGARKLSAAIDSSVRFRADGSPVYAVVKTVLEKTIFVEGDTYKVTVAYDSNSGLPEGVDLDVQVRNAADYQAAAEQALGSENISAVRAFDISILDAAGNHWNPTKDVMVSIELAEGAGLYQPHVVHIPGEEGAKPEAITPTVEGNTLTFPTDGFSVYVVVNTILEKTLTASDGNTYRISVSYDSTSGLPTEEEGAHLDVHEISSETQLTDVRAAIDSVRAENRSVAISRTFDIKILDADGNEVQPAEGSNVQIAFELVENGNANLTAEVYHMKQEGDELQAQNLPVTVAAGNTTTVITDGFSLYTVEFTYEGKQYVLNGGDIVRLDEVLEAIGITGTIEDAETSNPLLFDVNWNKYDGLWYVWAEQPFDTEEWLKVTVDGVVYEIVVTDAFFPGSGGSGKTGFARNAEIGTIAISDLINVRPDVTVSGDWENNSGLLGWTGEVATNGTKSISGTATARYSGLATTADGRKCDLELVFSNATIYGSDGGASTGFHRMINVTAGQLPAVSAYSGNEKFGLKVDVAVNLYLTGTTTKPEGTFFATVYGVNQHRTGSGATHLVGYNTNNHYSETVEVDGSYDVFFNSDYLDLDGKRISPPTSAGGAANYNTGIVIRGDAQTGVTYTAYQYAPNKSGTNMELMPRDAINYLITSYSSLGGSIVTDTHGDGTGTVLPGGVVGDPRVYVIPAGKSVSYRMTPNAGYVLKGIYIDGNLIADTEYTANSDGSYTYTFPAVGDTHKINVRWQMVDDLQLTLGHLGMQSDSNGGVTHVNLDGQVYSANPSHPRTTALDKNGAANKMGDLVTQPGYGAPAIDGYTFFTYALGYAGEGIPSQFYAKSDDLALRINEENEVQYCVNYTGDASTSTWETWSVKDSEGNLTVPKIYAVYTKDDTDTEHTVYMTATAIARNTTDPDFVDPGMDISFTETVTRCSYTISIPDPAAVTVDSEGKLTGGFTITKTSEQQLLNNSHTHHPGEAHGHALSYTTDSATWFAGDPAITFDVYADNILLREDAPTNYTLTEIVKKHGNRGTAAVDGSGDYGTFRIYTIGTSESHEPGDTYEVIRTQDSLTGNYIFTVRAKNPASSIEVEFINTRETVKLTLNELLEDERITEHDFTITVRGRELWSDGREHFSMLGSHTLTAQSGAATATGDATTTVTVPKNADILLIQRYGDTATTSSGATVKITEYDTEVSSDPEGVYAYRPLAKEYMVPGVSVNTAVTFTNRLKPRIVSVKKNLIGGDLNVSFEFTATIKDKNGDPWANQNVYTDDRGNTHPTDANGDIVFQLPGNGSIDLSVPWHASVTVVEAPQDGVGETRVRAGTGAEETKSEITVNDIEQNTEIVFTNVADFSVMNPLDVVTYEFYLDTACTQKYEFTLDAFGEEPVTTHRQILRDQSVLRLPPQPVSEGKVFKGWYRQSDSTLETGFGEKITVDSSNGGTTVKLYAVFADVAYAVFHNYPITEIINEQNTVYRPVYNTVSVEKVSGAYTIDLSTIAGPTAIESTQVFIGWADSEANADAGTIITENYNNYSLKYGEATHFYPVTQNKHRVSFYTGAAGSGAPYVPAAVLSEDEELGTCLPDMNNYQWTGRVFRGWYKNCDEQTNTYTDEVTAASTEHLSADITLYAKWDYAQTSNYTVILWKQKVSATNDGLFHSNEYDYAASSPMTANTLDGSGEFTNLSFTDSQIRSQFSSVDYDGFHFYMSENKSISPDGDTVVNVYYDRDIMKIVIKPITRSGQPRTGQGYTYPSSITYDFDESVLRDHYEPNVSGSILYGTYSSKPANQLTDADMFVISKQQIGWRTTNDKTNHNGYAMAWDAGYPVYPLRVGGSRLRVFDNRSPLPYIPIVNVLGYRELTNSLPISESNTVYLDSDQLGLVDANLVDEVLAAARRVEAKPYYGYVVGTSFSDTPTIYTGTVYSKMPSDTVATLTGLYDSQVSWPTEYLILNFNSNTSPRWQNVVLPRYNFDIDLGDGNPYDEGKTITVYAANKTTMGRIMERWELPSGMTVSEFQSQLTAGTQSGSPAAITYSYSMDNNVDLGVNPNQDIPGYSAAHYRSFYEKDSITTGGYRPSTTYYTGVNWSDVKNQNGQWAYLNDTRASFRINQTGNNVNYIGNQNATITNPLTIQVLFLPVDRNIIFLPYGSSTANGQRITLKAKHFNTLSYTFDGSVSDEYTKYQTYLNHTDSNGDIVPQNLSGATITPPTGMVFAGWYLDEACTEGNEFDPDTTVITKETFVFAKWEKAKYYVIFDPNGGELTGEIGNGSTWFRVDDGETIDDYSTFLKRDYDEYDEGTFYYQNNQYDDYEGTYRKKSDENVAITGSSVVPSGTYNLNDYVNPPHTATYKQGTPTLPNDGKTYRYLPNVWKFVRWEYQYRNSDGWPSIWNRDGFDFDTAITRHVRLKAIWEKAAALKIVYDPGEGTVKAAVTGDPFGNMYTGATEEDNRYTVGATVTMNKVAVPNDTRLKFMGWKPRASTTKDIYPLGSEYIVKSQDVDNNGLVITMVAQYEKMEITSLVYDANGGEGNLSDLQTIVDNANTAAQAETPPRTVTMIADSASNTIHNIELNDTVKLSAGTGFTRSGYALVGWSRMSTITANAGDTENGWTKYFNDDGTVKDTAVNKCFALDQNAVIDGATGNKLYAVWKRIPICKIGDTVYYTLRDAVAAAGSTATIEMLIDYQIPEDDSVTIPSGKNITFTTAAKTGTNPYTGDGTTGTLSRKKGFTGASLFTVANGGSLTFTNLTLDGNSVNATATVNGGLVNNAGTLTLGTGATMTNSATTTNGGAVYSTGTVVLNDGATVTGNGKGGAIHAESGAVQISGKVKVYGNLDGSNQKNIVINAANTIQVTGALDEDAEIGVYSANTAYTDPGMQFGIYTGTNNTNLDVFRNDVRDGVRGKKGRTANTIIWPEPNAVLTVSKTVSGAMGDHTKEFEFVLEGLDPNSLVAYQIKQTTDGTNYTDGTSGDYTSDSNGSITFKLKHYEKIELTVPVDLELELSETPVTGYKTWMQTETALTQAGKMPDSIEEMSENAAKSTTVTLTDDETLHVRNRLDAISPTGVNLTYAPYLLMLLFGSLLLVLRRKKQYNK